MTEAQAYFLVGGAGFIGGHFVDRLMARSDVSRVTVYDNFSSGREWHLERHLDVPRLRVVRGDATDLRAMSTAMEDHDTVIHLASNPDIARAVTEPAIDFDQGTFLTHNVVEAMRITRTKQILYASGSGVYGDLGQVEAHEDYGPLVPISTYGASKLAGEALISAYTHMFGLRGCVYRFANVVGERQTHGVGFDFLRQLESSPGRLRILGDGTQSKSYIHVSDVIDAVLLAADTAGAARFRTYNVATADYITVTEIAELAVECMGLPEGGTEFVYAGGDRGWAGDVPIVRLSTERIRSLGWRNKMTTKEALKASMQGMLADAATGRLWA
ncbi:MAG: NAD-dependent epimerase/dehydratase family protein [Candidatus Dormibacteria bacterium]